MGILKKVGMVIVIIIFGIYFRLRGGKRIAINWPNKEAVEIPIKGGQ